VNYLELLNNFFIGKLIFIISSSMQTYKPQLFYDLALFGLILGKSASLDSISSAMSASTYTNNDKPKQNNTSLLSKKLRKYGFFLVLI